MTEFKQGQLVLRNLIKDINLDRYARQHKFVHSTWLDMRRHSESMLAKHEHLHSTRRFDKTTKKNLWSTFLVEE